MQCNKLGEPLKIWDCAKSAIKTLKLNQSDISNSLSGRQKTAGGFRWTNCSNYGFPKVSVDQYVLNAG